jgi:hypothetical protein
MLSLQITEIMNVVGVTIFHVYFLLVCQSHSAICVIHFFLGNQFRLSQEPYLPTAVAAPSQVWLCGRSFGGIVGSNPAGAWMSVCCVCCVLSKVVRACDTS